jgi:hypothetical protein
VPPSPDPAVNRLRATVAAHARWSRATADERLAGTAAGRRAFHDRFIRLVDPDGVLDPAERAKLAENARKAHFTKMAMARHIKARGPVGARARKGTGRAGDDAA